MVLQNFYTVLSKEVVEKEKVYSFEILINNEHPIFEGHFPDNPIMPGVCMMQITKDLAEGIVDSKLFMKKCSNVKFMAIINPEVNKKLQLKLTITNEEDEEIKVRNLTKFDSTIALKLTAIYKKV